MRLSRPSQVNSRIPWLTSEMTALLTDSRGTPLCRLCRSFSTLVTTSSGCSVLPVGNTLATEAWICSVSGRSSTGVPSRLRPLAFSGERPTVLLGRATLAVTPRSPPPYPQFEPLSGILSTSTPNFCSITNGDCKNCLDRMRGRCLDWPGRPSFIEVSVPSRPPSSREMQLSTGPYPENRQALWTVRTYLGTYPRAAPVG
jgi:hypothetical protein